jgi:glycosyltransferase involved in cell wall biosynthesis
MRIGISSEFVAIKHNGTATYSRNLLTGLALLAPDHTYVPYLSTPAALPLMPSAPHIQPQIVGPYNAWVRVPFTLPLALAHRPVDLLHTQNWAPPWLPCPLVVTTHDVVWEANPTMFPKGLGARVRLLARWTSRRATRIITSSRYSAADIARLHRVSPDNIRVIHLPIDPQIRRVHDHSALAALQARYGISRPYILYVGSIEPRKNIGGLIRAFAELRRSHDLPHQLVIAGKPVYLFEDDLALPGKLGIERDVIWAGQVPDADLPGLYSGASAFVTLALYEGFGLPPLEAMACETPVLAANTTSLPEALGDGALLVDPHRLDHVVPLLARLLTDEPLQREQRARGSAWVRQFEPARLARQVVDVYEECVAQPVRWLTRSR